MAFFKGHFIVLGRTGTGKGVLVSSVAMRYRHAGVPVFLLTPKPDEYATFPADFKTMDQDRFLYETMNHKFKSGIMAVIDESWKWKWDGKNGLEAIPNSGRSRGIEMWAQGQRAYQTPPNVRENCDNVFCFYQNSTSKKWLVENYGNEFDCVDALQPGQYVYKAGLNPIKRGCSFTMANGVFKRV